MAETNYLVACSKAREFGATSIENGINWAWAKGFPTEAHARQFVNWLADNDWAHRGAYPPSDNDPTFAVRFR